MAAIESAQALAKDVAGTLALMALLAVAFGAVLRRARRPRLARVGLGVAFGAAAVLAMFDPIVIVPGVVVDLRAVPLALAGAFLGAEAVAVAVAMAALMRWGIGGVGAGPGILGLALSGALGLGWARIMRGGARGLGDLLALAALVALHWGVVALMPADFARRFLVEVVPWVLAAETLGIVLVGLFMERERRRVEAEWRLAREAERDPLTGLLNRRGFERAVAARPRAEAGALLLLDLDHFKEVNDRHGHPAGDAVLRALAARLQALMPEGREIARLGGEEFAAFVPGMGADEARALAARMREAVRARPVPLPGGGEVRVTASLGGAHREGDSLAPLVARADAALYAAKRAGRDRCRFVPAWRAEEGDRADGGAPAVDHACRTCALGRGCDGCGDRAAAPPALAAAS